MNDERARGSGHRLAERSTRRNVLRGLIGAAVVGVAGSGFRGLGSQAQESDGAVDRVAAPGDIRGIFDANPAPAGIEPSTRLRAAGSGDSGEHAVSFSAAVRLVLSPSAGIVGSTVSASVSGFRPNEYVEISWLGNRGFDVIASGRVNRSGRGTFTFTVPATSAGRTRVAVAGRSFYDDAYFEVLRSLQLSPTSGPGGTAVRVSLQGFRANIPHRIVIYPYPFRAGVPTDLGRISTSGNGSGSTVVTIPAGTSPGAHWIEVIEPGGRTASGAMFTVVAVSTATPNATVSVQPSTATPTPQPTVIGTQTTTPEGTITVSPSTATPTPQPTYTVQPSTATPTPQPTSTIQPSTATPTPQPTVTILPSTPTPSPEPTYTIAPSTSTPTPPPTSVPTLGPTSSPPVPSMSPTGQSG